MSRPVTPVQVGHVGAGAMGANHARVVNANSDTELAVVVDVLADRARRLAAEIGAGWSIDPATAGSCEATVVAITAETHVDVAMRTLSAGIPTLVVKPLD